MDNGRDVALDAEAQGGAHGRRPILACSLFFPSIAPFLSTGSYGQKGAETKTDSLWEIYVKEAESRDKSLMETWISAMDSVILFVRLQSTPSGAR